MSERSLKKASMLGVSIWAMIAAVPSYAQSDEALDTNFERGNDIVVTAQRREQSLQDVPLSVTVVGAEEIERGQIDGLLDYALRIPNFQAVNLGAPGRSDLSIRGVSNIGGQASSIAVYYDGFAVSGTGSVGFDLGLYDVSRIEVLRGPQGTLFGRNTIAGAVNLVLAKPTDRFEGRMEAEHSSYGTWLARGVLNIPIIGDTLMARGNVSFEDSDGFIRDLGDANNSDRYRRWSGRVALRLDTGPLTMDATVIHGDDRQGIISSIPTGIVTNVVRNTTGISEGLDPLNTGFFPDNRRTIATDAPQENQRLYTTAILNIDYDFGPVSAILLTGFQETEFDAIGDFDRTIFNAVTQTSNIKNELFSMELRLQSNHGGAFSWLIGGAFNQDRNTSDSITVFREDFFSLLGLPTFLAPFNVADQETSLDVDTIAAFGSLEWASPDRRWTLSVSARYTRDKLLGRYIDDSQSFDTGLPAGIDITLERTFEDIQPRFSLTYSPTSFLTGYVTVSKGYKAGGFNVGAQFVPGSPDSYGKEIAWNYEAGIKGSTADNRFRGSLSVFRMDWTDIQVDALFRGSDLIARNFTQNAATASVTGFELELGANPTRNFDLNVAFGFNRGRFSQFDTAIDEDGIVFDASDNRLPNAPDFNLSIFGEYRIPLAPLRNLFARAEYALNGGFFTNTENRREVGYFVNETSLVNLRAGYRDDSFSVSVFAENLGASGSAFAYEVNNFLSGIQAIIRPERYGVRLGYNF